jgi:hypothetical protein
MKRIYLVFEIGSGEIHRAFFSKEKAEQFIEILKEQNDMDCYEIIWTNLED